MADSSTRARATGLQAAQVSLAAHLRSLRDALGDDEYAELLELHHRTVDRERGRRDEEPLRLSRLRLRRAA
jgi:hypothetical protein